MASRPRPIRPAASDAFPKVRRDHARETAEDYVEAIGDLGGRGGTCRVADLARHMRVSHVTVVRTIARLSAAGLVEKERYGPVRLTPSGARMAAAARERHRQVFAFLVAIGVPESVARRDAEGLEHHVSPATIAAMRRVVA